MLTDPRIARIVVLVARALRPPPGAGRIALALALGMLCHSIFAAAVLAMMTVMFFGMSESFGRVQWPSALFALWTPSGIVWWRAEGGPLWATSAAYAASWLLLLKASFDAGAEVQSGALGWMSLMARKPPVFPDMPTAGLFRLIRQPIYVAFALTLWTVPVCTPDQLALAICYTGYCLLAPRLKERRFAKRYGSRFAAYRANVPYVLPWFGKRKDLTRIERSR